jgi:hypothetical protein
MFERKYGVATHIYIPIPKASSANHAVSGDWTPAAGDVKISKDGGATANVTNLPTAIAMGNSTIWDFSLTATEMQAAQIMITVSDSATKAVDDTGFIIETYGNASALHAFDKSTATPTVDVSKWLGTAAAAPSIAGVPKVDMHYLQGFAYWPTAQNALAWDGTAVTGTLSATQATTTLTGKGDDVFNYRWGIYWLDGTARATQFAVVTDYVSATGLFTFAPALTGAPVNGDAFVLRPILSGLAVGDRTGNLSGSVGSLTTNNDKTGYTLSSAGVQAIWDALTAALTTANSIGKRLVDNIDATISSRLATSGYTTPPTVGAIADQVWEEALADHSGTVGSVAEALDNAGSAGDPWSTALPGAYGAGTAGKIVGDNINATVSSRSSHSAADVWAVATRILTAGTNIVLAKGTGVTGFNDLDAAGVRSAVGLAAADLDTQLDDIAALLAIIDTDTDDLEGRLTSALATVLQAHSLAVGRLVVDTGSTTTSVVFKTVNGAAASAVDDHYNGRVIVFTSGTLTLQAVEITDYVGATKTATISAATSAPGNNVTAVIV